MFENWSANINRGLSLDPEGPNFLLISNGEALFTSGAFPCLPYHCISQFLLCNKSPPTCKGLKPRSHRFSTQFWESAVWGWALLGHVFWCRRGRSLLGLTWVCPSELADHLGAGWPTAGGPGSSMGCPSPTGQPRLCTGWQCSESSKPSAQRSLNLVSVTFHSCQEDPPRLQGGERTLPPPGQSYKVTS